MFRIKYMFYTELILIKISKRKAVFE
ncbi:hypothetical protein PT2222_140342 [Paraburkholderia tropica]